MIGSLHETMRRNLTITRAARRDWSMATRCAPIDIAEIGNFTAVRVGLRRSAGALTR